MDEATKQETPVEVPTETQAADTTPAETTAPEVKTESEPANEPGEATKALTTSWLDDIDPEHRQGLEKFEGKSISDLAKSYKELQTFVGKKFPGEDASDAEKDAFYKQLGRPDTPDGYSLPEDESIQYNEEALGKFKELFHKNGITDKQAVNIMEAYNDFVKQGLAGQEEQNEAAQKEREAFFEKEFNSLKEDWGAKFDENVAAAQRAARAFGLATEDMDSIEKAIGPRKLIEMFHRVGESLSDDQIVDGIQGNKHRMSPQEARVELNKMMKDPDVSEALMNKGNPMHAIYNKKRLDLIRISNQTNN